MALQDRGVHIITWGATGEALDVSGGDDRSLIVFQRHGWANQQWTLEWVAGRRYRIRGHGGYVSFNGEARDGTQIEYSENDQVWLVAPFPETYPSDANPNPAPPPEGYYIMHEPSQLVLEMRVRSNSRRIFLGRYNATQNWFLTHRPN